MITFGGAALVFGGFAWGIYAKRPRAQEAQAIAMAVLKQDDAEAHGRDPAAKTD